jgi:hypothetical protein
VCSVIHLPTHPLIYFGYNSLTLSARLKLVETALGRFNPDLGTRCALMILAAGESSSGMLTG